VHGIFSDLAIVVVARSDDGPFLVQSLFFCLLYCHEFYVGFELELLG